MARRIAQRRSMARITRGWMPVLIYVGVIFVVSAQPRLRPPFHFSNADKLMHTLEYSGLGFLMSRAWSERQATSHPAAAALAAICCGIMVGTADELFQSTVPGRTCSPFDLAADTLGLSIGGLVHRALSRG